MSSLRYHPVGTWRRAARRAIVMGAAATMLAATAAAAEPPYPPDEIDGVLCGTNDDPVANDCNEHTGIGTGTGTGGAGGGVTSAPTVECVPFEEHLAILKLTGDGIDFGDNTFVFGAPLGPGSVTWSVPCNDYYSARVIGTLHLDGVPGARGRLSIEYFWNGGLVEERVSSSLFAADNGHHERAINMGPIGENVDEIRVCTEISPDDDGHYDAINCKTRFS